MKGNLQRTGSRGAVTSVEVRARGRYTDNGSWRNFTTREPLPFFVDSTDFEADSGLFKATITHNLNTLDVIFQSYRENEGLDLFEDVFPERTQRTKDTLYVWFATRQDTYFVVI